MSQSNKDVRPEARIAKGFRDIEAQELSGLDDMLSTIREVYERYGFVALETPALEYTDALGKFLPDQDRPNAGVFSFQDDDEQWMSLRYDLTAPLARYVAQNYQTLPKPFRRYAFGNVYRNEKPGPGRFRQFMQFDADTIGSDSMAADAEMCMLAADTLEALGIKRGDYVIKLCNRKLLDGILEGAAIDASDLANRVVVFRAIDKLDRLGLDGVEALLGKGRRDESGDFTEGAGLHPVVISKFIGFLRAALHENAERTRIQASGGRYEWRSLLDALRGSFGHHKLADEALTELESLGVLLDAAGYFDGRTAIDLSVVRGLEYYTGPVFEAELTFPVKDGDGNTVRFGSVGGGGRYDDLVARFTGQKVPATGFAIGVSRLQAALSLVNGRKDTPPGPVVVLVLDKDNVADYQKMTQELRNAGISAEMYLGSSGMKAQMKYADKRNSPCVIIQGSDERAKGEVTIKDLVEGAKAAAAIKDNKEWKEARPAQLSVPQAQLVDEVRKIIARHRG